MRRSSGAKPRRTGTSSPGDAALADTGDMTKLVQDHGWNESLITHRYTALSAFCALAIALDQAVACARAMRRERAAKTTTPAADVI